MLRSIVDKYFIKKPRLRSVVTAAIYGRDDRDISLVGVRVRINSLRENGYLRAYFKSQRSVFLEHELNVLATLSMLASECDGFIDAGANVGIFSCILARRKALDPSFEMLAFEPHPDTFKRLQHNVTPYGVIAHNVALSRENGSLTFVDGSVSHVFTAAEHANRYNIPGAVIYVQSQRLDSLPILGCKLLLKIDVEGHESAVLEGATGLFEQNRIRAVYCDGHDMIEVPNFLKAFGFDLFDISNQRRTDGCAYGLLAIRPSKATFAQTADTRAARPDA